jgi:hypothetical protein
VSTRAARNVKTPIPDRKPVRCVGKTKGGGPCRAATVRGTDRCLFHTRDQAARMGREGGRPRFQYDVSKLKKFAPPKDAAEMRLLLATMVIEMREGKIEVELATKVSYVASVFLKSTGQEEELRRFQDEMKPKVDRLQEIVDAMKNGPVKGAKRGG